VNELDGLERKTPPLLCVHKLVESLRDDDDLRGGAATAEPLAGLHKVGRSVEHTRREAKAPTLLMVVLDPLAVGQRRRLVVDAAWVERRRRFLVVRHTRDGLQAGYVQRRRQGVQDLHLRGFPTRLPFATDKDGAELDPGDAFAREHVSGFVPHEELVIDPVQLQELDPLGPGLAAESERGELSTVDAATPATGWIVCPLEVAVLRLGIALVSRRPDSEPFCRVEFLLSETSRDVVGGLVVRNESLDLWPPGIVLGKRD